jgi:SPOR domain
VDDGYAYAYDEEPERQPEPKRRGGMVTVAAVLALAVFGVGGAFAYRTYSGSARTGEPPIIRADAGPTKIIPSPPDGATKVPDRMAAGDVEKIVSREETPLDPNSRSIPRVVWPAPQTSSPPPNASIAPTPAGPANGTMPNSEPHRIRTFAVRGEQAEAGVPLAAPPQPLAAAKPAPRPAAAAPLPAQRTASAANASANAPMSLSPQVGAAPPAPAAAAETQTRVAAINPVQTAPSSGGSTGGYLVQVSSQQSEADAEASYRALQNKYPSVLGPHTPLIKRANVGEKVVYRALIGPFASPAEASQFCGNLKSAGGQCFIQRN